MSAPTSTTTRPRRARRRVWAAPRLHATTAAVSCGWGALSLWMHESWPPPWDVGGNSVATWVIVPFLLGRRAASQRRAALVGLVSLVLLVASYYVTLWAATGRGDSASTVSYWTLAALLLGGPLGVLGSWSASASLAGRAVCAVPGAAFLAEALPASARSIFLSDDDAGTRALWLALGVGVTLALARGSARGLLIALGALVVLTAGALVTLDVAVGAFVQLTSALG